MTKKHFEAIAHVLNLHNNLSEVQSGIVESIARGLADYFQQDNPRFQRDRFLNACGIDVKPDTCHYVPECKKGEDTFKCASCGEKYGVCMEATHNIIICRWCSGEEK